MKNAIIILTRLYIEEGSNMDEFRRILCPNSKNHKLIRELNVDILIIHGHDKRFISVNPFAELSNEAEKYLGTKKAYLFYHSGNEAKIKELPNVSAENTGNPFLDSISYSLDGAGDERDRGNVVAALYRAINENNSQKANECALEMLKNFQQDSNTQEVFNLVDAICNLPFKKNKEEVIELIKGYTILNVLTVNEIPIVSFIEDNHSNIVEMETAAIEVKKQFQNIKIN